MDVLKLTHHYSALCFAGISVLLTILYLVQKNKGNQAISILVKTEWFLSSFMFFIGLILLLLHSYWFQVGLFHLKISIAMFAIGASQYYYKQYLIAKSQNDFPQFLVKIRLVIPLLVFCTYYAGNLLNN